MPMKFFNGTDELQGVHERGGRLVGYVDKADLSFVPGEGWTGFRPVERKIEYASRPSRHVCDSRCTHATGRVMKCECSCGGKNHGSFKAEEA